MALGPGLLLRQSQSLAMTPQLLQAIRLLQMSAIELERMVAAEIEANPVLDLAESGDEAGDAAAIAEPLASGDPEGDLDGEASGVAADAGADAASDVREAGDAAFHDRGSTATRLGEGDDLAWLENRPADAPSLWAMLEALIDGAFAGVDRAVALALLSALDAAGYLTEPLEELGRRLGVAEGRVEDVLLRLQRLSPPGLFARSLKECLALQLAARDRLDPLMARLLEHLPLLAENRMAALVSRLGCDREDLRGMIADLKALDPKPGLVFSDDRPTLLVPDLVVSPAPDGGWRVDLTASAQPALRIDADYAGQLGQGRSAEAARRFVSDCRSRANWLRRSLDQRAETLLAVAGAVMRRQEAFLRHGIEHLRPLTLRMIADELGLHESTVSRAVANKGLASPRGLFELRFFFSAALGTQADGEGGHSAAAVRHRIRRLVEAEDPDNPLSDDALVAALGDSGIVVARRTVAKYRDMLGIPSSHRRRKKGLALAS